ncbi:DUF3570 domain-containing protein [Flavobacterium sp. ASW18X]|uniref:DUF3570 domain-containing protein n=1 Tax=Flavobacterium sp. ASW18X TaxID=2572595 RepID=UPI001F0D5C37|nr:DUF3570 domain-containing protein [Flavobacterium sp. ASW18X]
MRPRYIYELSLVLFLCSLSTLSQQSNTAYQKRVLEQAELETLFSYYAQDGSNAAVTGGEGTEELTDATSTIVLRMPLNEDDILTLDAGISAYTSASSSNVDPFDSRSAGNAFQASSGASRRDVLAYFNPAYVHSSKDRNKIWSANAYVSNEYDYFSFGFGGEYTYLFNEKNTEFSFNGQVYLDKWNPQYPVELRPGYSNGIIGYDPMFNAFQNNYRNSYSLGLGFSQIVSSKLQLRLGTEIIYQDGLLSTPFQRVYFADRADFFQEEFQLADNVEQLPNSRIKIPVSARLNYYWNDYVVLRSFYRFYYDDWGIRSNTFQLEAPVKLGEQFTLYPNYRYYQQSAADYFYAKDVALSTYQYYTSDYDLSTYTAHQYGFGVQYKDIFTKSRFLLFGLKALNLRLAYYQRSNGLNATIVTLGASFVVDSN